MRNDNPLATTLNCMIIFYFSCFQTYVLIVSALIGMLYYVPKWNLNFIWYLNAGFIGFVCYSIIELSSGYWADRCQSKVITLIFNNLMYMSLSDSNIFKNFIGSLAGGNHSYSLDLFWNVLHVFLFAIPQEMNYHLLVLQLGTYYYFHWVPLVLDYLRIH